VVEATEIGQRGFLDDSALDELGGGQDRDERSNRMRVAGRSLGSE